VFENKVLRRIFELKVEELTTGLKKLHNEELHNLHCSLNIIIVIKARRLKETYFGEMRNIYKTRTQKHEGNKSFGRPTYECKVNSNTLKPSGNYM
jgi:hypothetical protein